MAKNNKLKRMWNGVVLAQFELKYRNLPGETEKNPWKIPQSG
jgi:hypothetical protein